MLYFEAPHPLPNPPPLRGRGGWGVKQINTFVLECIRIPPKKSSSLNRNWDCSEVTEEDKPSFEQETGGRLISIRILMA